MRNQSGFTLLELLLSVAIIGVLAGISMPLYMTFNQRNALNSSAEDVVAALRRAQTYARGVEEDSQWGVKIASGTATLFKGSSYASREISFDEPINIPANITVSGALTEVIFSKLVGAPATTGSVTLTSNTNETRTVTLNAKGMVSY